ncbi:MAG: lipase family protein [Bacilli bacterium]
MKKNLIITSLLTITLLTSCGGKGLTTNNNVSVTFRTTAENKDSAISNLTYDENWFFKDSYTYNEDLAEMSLGLTLSSADNEEYDVDNKTGDKNIKQLYEDLGFSSESYYSVGFNEEDTDKVALSIASKNVTNSGKESTILSINLRGIGYGSGGWISNFNIGEGKEDIDNTDNKQYHLGFYTAGLFAFNEIKTYVTDKNIDLDNTKVWLTGFSRSAAAANIASIFLGDIMDRKNIYTYAFATPAYKVNVTNDELLKNIFNIINSGDIVPMIPPIEWDFGIEGTKVELPLITEDTRSSFETELYNLCGITYTGLNDYESISKSMINMLLKYAPSREEYALVLEDAVKSIFNRKDDGSIDYSYIDNILSCEGTNEDAISIESLIESVKGIDFSDITAIIGLVTKIGNTLNAGEEYWGNKDSYNDELLEKISEIISFAITLYMGAGTDEEQLAFDTLKEIGTLGVTSPLLEQHWGEVYLARLRMHS